MYTAALLLHLLGASVWVGGHLVLALTILPRALAEGSVEELRRFEKGYERIGIPALLTQVVTGLWLALQRLPVADWFDPGNPLARPILLKLVLLGLTLALAADARLRLIPRLAEGQRLRALAWHIVPVTVIAVLLLATGVAFRTGL